MNSDAEIRITEDGSATLYLPHLDEHYHSIHGAVNESMHVFINAGLDQVIMQGKEKISILEIGLGTGLNVLLSIVKSTDILNNIFYTALEPFPLTAAQSASLHFENSISHQKVTEWYRDIHESEYQQEVLIEKNFTFIKYAEGLENILFNRRFDLIYFDAFSPKVQPDIWCAENFQKLFAVTNPGGILVTYCAKGAVRRNMIAAGYSVERLEGPPGKREMLRAVKSN